MDAKFLRKRGEHSQVLYLVKKSVVGAIVMISVLFCLGWLPRTYL